MTLVGDITIRRRAYKDRVTGKQVYLLDKCLNLQPYQQISMGVEEAAVLWAVKGPSYREARDRLKDLYGYQALSHESIRRRVLRCGEALTCKGEDVPVAIPAEGVVLGIEADGLWVSIQKKRGDEAPWIRAGVGHFARAIYQYDRFHISRELYRSLRGQKGKWEEAKRALEANDLPALCRVLEAAVAAEENPKHREHLQNLSARVKRDGASILVFNPTSGKVKHPELIDSRDF